MNEGENEGDPDGLDRLGDCLVACFDLWGSSAYWPERPDDAWVLEEVTEHNRIVDEAFEASRRDSDAPEDAERSPLLGDGRLYIVKARSAHVMFGFLATALETFRSGQTDLSTSVGVAHGPVVKEGGGKQERTDEQKPACPAFHGRPINFSARLAGAAAQNQALADESVDARYDDHVESAGLRFAPPNVKHAVRLPAVGSSWGWKRTCVRELCRKDVRGKPVRNRYAAFDQAARARVLLEGLKNMENAGFVERKTFQRFEQLTYEGGLAGPLDAEACVLLLEALDGLFGELSALQRFLNHYPQSTPPSDQGDRDARVKASQQFEELARFEEGVMLLVEGMRKCQAKFNDLRVQITAPSGIINPNCPLRSHDPEVREPFRKEIADTWFELDTYVAYLQRMLNLAIEQERLEHLEQSPHIIDPELLSTSS